MSSLIRKILQERFTNTTSIAIDESAMRDIHRVAVGSTVHPFRVRSGYTGPRYDHPLTVVKHTDTKTVLSDLLGSKYNVSHSTGVLKHEDSGNISDVHGFHTREEKAVNDKKAQNLQDKHVAIKAIRAHLDNITNPRGEAVGQLSDDTHKEILAHLEKLRNK